MSIHKILILCKLIYYIFGGYKCTRPEAAFHFSEEAFSAGKQFIRYVGEEHLEAAKTNLNNVTDVRHVTGQQTHYFLRHFHDSSLHCEEKLAFFFLLLFQLKPIPITSTWLVSWCADCRNATGLFCVPAVLSIRSKLHSTSRSLYLDLQSF
jgi:hypothetical protein